MKQTETNETILIKVLEKINKNLEIIAQNTKRWKNGKRKKQKTIQTPKRKKTTMSKMQTQMDI